jgi:tetratricopeptide (TPR) repeat protein
VVISLAVASKRRSDAEGMRAELRVDVERGGIGDLAKAQTRGRRILVTTPTDGETIAALAFTEAVLAADYGMGTVPQAVALLARRTDEKAPEEDFIAPMKSAAHALVLLRAGDREAARRESTRAAASAPGSPYPLYALGRARAVAGDLPGAARALEAAIVGSPGFFAARVSWAEVELDLGEAKAARQALRAVLAQSPQDLRAQLLLEEANEADDSAKEAGKDAAPSTTPARCQAGAETDRGRSTQFPPAFFQAACALGAASRARRSGSRTVALVRAKEAAASAPEEPRLLARIALELAQLGAVDRAATVLARARRLAAPETVGLAWAGVAVALGRGRAPALPEGKRPADPETGLLAARASLAAGGVGELGQVLDRMGAGAISADADLLLLARLRESSLTEEAAPTTARGRRGAAETDEDDPLRAYVDGLWAQLHGDHAAAAERFWHALSGHGDACRAVGEYVATLRALKLPADPSAWRALPAENAGCVNLR